MRRKPPFSLSSFYLILGIFLTMSPSWSIASSGNTDLETVLEKCAKYCEKLDDLSLYYVCKEKVKEVVYHPYLGYTNVFVYDYQLIRKNKKITEKRILIEENGQKKQEKDAQLKTEMFFHKKIIFGPYGLLCRKKQKDYDYKIIKKAKFLGKKAVVIEASPKSAEAADDLYGKIWVAQDDFSILKIEWKRESIENPEVAEILAERYEAKPHFTITAEYGIKEKGIRFPSQFTIDEAYIKPKSHLRINRSKTVVDYYDYEFFEVETDVKY